jgi:hypothetical protein
MKIVSKCLLNLSSYVYIKYISCLSIINSLLGLLWNYHLLPLVIDTSVALLDELVKAFLENRRADEVSELVLLFDLAIFLLRQPLDLPKAGFDRAEVGALGGQSMTLMSCSSRSSRVAVAMCPDRELIIERHDIYFI